MTCNSAAHTHYPPQAATATITGPTGSNPHEAAEAALDDAYADSLPAENAGTWQPKWEVTPKTIAGDWRMEKLPLGFGIALLIEHVDLVPDFIRARIDSFIPVYKAGTSREFILKQFRNRVASMQAMLEKAIAAEQAAAAANAAKGGVK
jgi:hypothetical protein